MIPRTVHEKVGDVDQWKLVTPKQPIGHYVGWNWYGPDDFRHGMVFRVTWERHGRQKPSLASSSGVGVANTLPQAADVVRRDAAEYVS